MSFKQAAVLGPVCFFLGVLFLCFNIDHALLWGDLTEDVIQHGFQFYTTFYHSPPAIKALLHGMVGVGLIGLLAKLHTWDDSAMFFDGTCIGAYVFAIAVYITVTVNMLRVVAQPLETETFTDRIEAMRVVSASNVIVGFFLIGILVLQAGQEYAKRADSKSLPAQGVANSQKTSSVKKDQ